MIFELRNVVEVFIAKLKRISQKLLAFHVYTFHLTFGLVVVRIESKIIVKCDRILGNEIYDNGNLFLEFNCENSDIRL